MTQVIVLPRSGPKEVLRLAEQTPGVIAMPPERWLRARDERALAAAYFGPMADALEQPSNSALLLPGWTTVRRPLARLLERTALTLSARSALPADPQHPPSQPRDPSLGPIYPLSESNLGLLGATPSHDPTLDGYPASADQGPPGWALGLPCGHYGAVEDLTAWAKPEGPVGPGAGGFWPDGALLVGERPHVARTGQLKHRLPFVSFDGQGCAVWLSEGLENAGIPERALYWINAYDALGVPTDSGFVALLKPRLIVALGKLAERWCADSGLEFESVPHPQFWKRFHGKEPYRLYQLLTERLI